MTPQQEDLDRFLDELSGRRMRLLGLVGSESVAQTALVDELNDLGEQLLVADEELRVQQEELDDARRQISTLRTDRDHLFDSTTDARVLTDEKGLVLQTSRAADRLMLLPAARVKPRPIATWFDVAYRPQVRRMIGRSAHSQIQALDHALVRRPDGSTMAVRVLLHRAPGEPGVDAQLQWSLIREETATPRLRLVETLPPPVRPEAAQSEPRLSTGVAALVARLAQRPPLAEAWSTIVEEASALVDGAAHAGLVLDRRRAPGVPVAGSDTTAEAADRAQLELGGPLSATLADHRTHGLDDTSQPSEWPAFAEQAAALGIRAVLTVPLTVAGQLPGPDQHDPGRSRRPDQHVGALCLYADVAGALDGAEAAASLLAAHAAVGLVWLGRESSLQEALLNRQLIGEAVGVLVERRKLTSEAAFEVLVHRSQDANLKLRELARILVETGQDPSEITAP